MKIIVGLGNPGEKYNNTRHNIGFAALDDQIKKLGLNWSSSKKFNSDIIKDGKTIYVKPKTFMNNSGLAVEAIMSFYKLLPKKMGLIKEKNSDLTGVLTVIHDDLDLPLGKSKVSTNSRAAGHNGVQSIINHLKTKNFTRLRLGIDTKRPEQMAGKDFVLGKFRKEEEEIVNQVFHDLPL